ncbi:MAG: CHASE domain-containing protein [Novosphingobium sp.]|nr:CHASE domain-containing protein [Novosphingobium sp.]
MMDNAILARVEKQAWFHKYPRGWPFLLFLMTAVGTALSVASLERADRQREQAELEGNATEITSAIQRRVAENVAVLRAAGALFGTRDNVTQEEFAEFAQDLHANGNHFGSLGLGWAPLIAPLNVSAFEVTQRESGREDFLVHPRPQAGQVQPSTPILFLDPMTPANRRAIGFDMCSEEVRCNAMTRAIELRAPVASGKVHLVQDRSDPEAIGFLIYMPVTDYVAGRNVVKGFVYSPFRADDFLASAAQIYRDVTVDISVYDQQATDESLLARQEVQGQSGVSVTRKVEVANREWIVTINSKKSTILSPLSRATLVFGIILSLIIMYVGRMITKRAVEDRQVLEWLSRQSSIRDSLTRELNHRVKNTLANVLSIVSLTRRRSVDLDDFAESLTARIRALSATHDLLSQSNWTSAALGEVIRSELAPYIEGDEAHVEISGPDINLAPNDALSLGLAIHELATNAAKYGALGSPEGKVIVNWRELTSDRAEVHWREEGGPPVHEPTRRGFGRDLIEKIVAHELQSKVDLQFRPEGVECRLVVPVRRITEFTLRRDNTIAAISSD